MILTEDPYSRHIWNDKIFDFSNFGGPVSALNFTDEIWYDGAKTLRVSSILLLDCLHKRLRSPTDSKCASLYIKWYNCHQIMSYIKFGMNRFLNLSASTLNLHFYFDSFFWQVQMCLFYDRWESHLKIRALPSTVILSLSWRLRWLKLFQDCVATKSKRDITK